jgi:uncharacterized membrane protein
MENVGIETAVNEQDLEASVLQETEKSLKPVKSKAEKSLKPVKSKADRIWELDALKTFAFFYMVFDHAMFNIAYVFATMWNAPAGHFLAELSNFALSYRNSRTAELLRIFLCAGVFLFCSGISSTLSKNNLKRGGKLSIAALALTLSTYLAGLIFNADLIIVYGIIALLATCTLLSHVLTKLDCRVLVLIALWCMFFGSFFSRFTVMDTLVLPALNFHSPFYYSLDHWPFFPYAAFFIFGIVAGKLLYKQKKSLLPLKPNIFTKSTSFLSRKLLILYFAHQVILFGLLYFMGVAFAN